MHPNNERTTKNIEGYISPGLGLDASAPSAQPRRKRFSKPPEGFEAFYQAYPKHVEPKAAARAYEKVVTSGEATPHQLLAGAERYAAERASQDPKFTKHPATWLNKACWNDEAAHPPRADNGAGALSGLKQAALGYAFGGDE